jgi:hypothetical protein
LALCMTLVVGAETPRRSMICRDETPDNFPLVVVEGMLDEIHGNLPSGRDPSTNRRKTLIDKCWEVRALNIKAFIYFWVYYVTLIYLIKE